MAEHILYYIDETGAAHGIKNPSSLQWSLNDVEGKDGSGTNQLGKTFRDVVARKQQLSCSWGLMTTEEMKTLLGYLNHNFIKLKYLNPSEGMEKTGEFYVSSKSAPVYSYDKVTGTWMWSSMSATLVER